MLHAENSLWGRLMSAPAQDEDDLPGRPVVSPDVRGLPLPGAASLARVLAGRRSARAFAGVPVEPGDLERVIAAAVTADRLWSAAGDEPVLLVAARDLRDHRGGWYLAEGAAGLRPVPGAVPLRAMADRYVDAPVLLFVCLDIDRATRVLGARGYPASLVRAGAFGQTALLGAQSLGLAGCPFGGAGQEITGIVRAVVDRPVRHMFTVAIGTAA